MSTSMLATKLYIPRAQPGAVLRPRLTDRLNAGLHRTLTLISAPAGFGKTTLIREWVTGCERPVAWLSLDEGENNPTSFLAYLVAALQTLEASVGSGVLAMLQSPQPPPIDAILTALINEIATIPNEFILVLDDYHSTDSRAIDDALAVLLEHLPPRMHLVIATREDPMRPLARLRAQGQLTELRAGDLRFTAPEATDFLNQVMGLNLSADNVAALEARTEGWIAGLQLAALSMQGSDDVSGFIASFTGSHRFVLDYLIEEVLQQQPEHIQSFLLRTSILGRLCGPLCDAVLLDSSISGQVTLEHLERANLFLFPLDNERHWYRYHHLFAELLRQRLRQGDQETESSIYHERASQWFEDHGLAIEAFRHAVAAGDVERAERLIESDGLQRHFQGTVTTILDWFESLPRSVLDARPTLWWRHAAMMLIHGQTTGVEEKLQAAEASLQDPEADRNLVGRIAAARAVLALTRYQADEVLRQSIRALEYLDPNNLSDRGSANWTLGFAYQQLGDLAAARRAYSKTIAVSQGSGDTFTRILATIGLGNIQESENQLHPAAQSYQQVLELAGPQPLHIICEAHLGLARVLYEWNELDGAEQHGQHSLQLARQYDDRVIDRSIVSEVFLARLKMAQGDLVGAAAMLDRASQSAHQQNFVYRIPEVAAAQVEVMLRQGRLTAAAALANEHHLPISQARVQLACGDPAKVMALLEPLRQQGEEQIETMILLTIALDALGRDDEAAQLLDNVLAMAEPGGFIRSFVDKGAPMAQLLSKAAEHGIRPDYTDRLLAAFKAESEGTPQSAATQPLIEPLTERELDVLRLIAQGLSNREISEQLYLAVSTVKGHNRKIFAKLQVQRRTEAVARARDLNLL